MNFPTMTKRMKAFGNRKDGARIAKRQTAQTIEKKKMLNRDQISRDGAAPTPAPRGHDPVAARRA